MKIGLIQHNPTPGDFPRNVRSLVDGYRECVEAGASLVFTPSLALPGNGCRDLARLSRFFPQAEDALAYLATEVMSVPLCVGTLTRLPSGEYVESCAILCEGKVLQTISYGNQLSLFEVSGMKILLLPEGCTANEAHKTDLILRPSSNRWYAGKEQEDILSLQSCAKSLQAPAVCCASAGANDYALYNGQSFAVNSSGELAGRLGAFTQDSLIFDLDTQIASKNISSPEEMELLYLALVTALRDYCTATGMNSVCLGLSGGIDSALVAVLATEALGKENVLGITMPSPYSSQGSIDDSRDLARNLGIEFHQVPVTPVFDSVKASLAPLFAGYKEDVTEENIQSRIRGLFLMAAANKFGHLLLSTGNKSEAAIGYSTLYGDSCGGIALIGDLYKKQVYALSRWINRNGEIIPISTLEKAPSAELRPDQKDEDTLPPYKVLDALLKLFIEKDLSASDIIAQYDFDEETVRWVQRRIVLNEWKRKQGAFIPQVSRRGFAPPRDYPIAQNFRD